MRIAVIGSGIAGIGAAWALSADNHVTLFESNERVGGHSRTLDIDIDGRAVPVDTGFIVYNERNYPHFTALLKKLGVSSQPTRMTFGFSSEQTGVEYAGGSLDGLFAQRPNLFSPSYWWMLAEILRFFRLAKHLAADPDPTISLGDFLDEHRFSREFQNHHLLPMGAAIWSSPPSRMRAFPAVRFVQFFDNHGLLSLRDRPQWRVVRGGSARYVEALTRKFRDRIRLESPVAAVARDGEGASLVLDGGRVERFDAILAWHAKHLLTSVNR